MCSKNKGKFYTLNKTNACGYMGEAPCTPSYNNGQFNSWKKIGDVYRVKAEIPEGVSYTADLPNDAELEIISNKM